MLIEITPLQYTEAMKREAERYRQFLAGQQWLVATPPAIAQADGDPGHVTDAEWSELLRREWHRG